MEIREGTLAFLLAASSFAAIGWAVEQFVDNQRQKNQWELDFVTKQINELYGPLYFEVTEGREAWENFTFERNRDFPNSQLVETQSTGQTSQCPTSRPTPDQRKMWDFWKDNEFLPRNNRIEELLRMHPELIVTTRPEIGRAISGSGKANNCERDPDIDQLSAGLAKSYVHFLAHYQAWAIDDKRSKVDSNFPYTDTSLTDWPSDFEKDVIETYRELKEQQGELKSALR